MLHRLALLLVLFPCSVTTALDEAQIKSYLQRPIIGSEQTLAEAQYFTETRVPTMPDVKSQAEWEKIATQIRQDVLNKVVYRGEAAKWREMDTKVEWLDVIDGGESYRIKKLRFEAVPGMWIPALLYEPLKLDGKVPVIMNVNGHDRANGKAADYKQTRCINQAKRGMIALNVEWIGMGQLQSSGNAHYAMNQLDLCGTSGLAPFYLAMKRGLDVLLAHKNADPKRVGVAGLSGGGWQTIVISSLDTRVTLSNPVAGYSSFITRARQFKDLGDSEQTPNDLAAYADYTHLTAMLAPRAGLLTFNKTDNCCFEATYALQPLMDAAEPIYKLFDQRERLRSHVNVDPGTHNFGQDNRQALYRMIGDHFYAGDTSYDSKEIECASEIKTKDKLNVPIPDDNATFNSLALQLSKPLPKQDALPTNRADAVAWQESSRELLNNIIRSDREPYDYKVQQQDSFTRAGMRITYWRLRVGDSWTVPVTEFDPPDADGAAIVISDQGRMSCSAQVSALVTDNKRVLAVDPFYFGEAKVSQKDFLFAFMIATVGRRPLGVQANQIAAVARWAKNTGGKAPVVIADGSRTSTIALTAAAIETDAIAAVQLHGAISSFKELIARNETANKIPELFCFGLLENFDVVHLAALVCPRNVNFIDGDNSVTEQMKPLAAWNKTLGK